MSMVYAIPSESDQAVVYSSGICYTTKVLYDRCSPNPCVTRPFFTRLLTSLGLHMDILREVKSQEESISKK